MSRDSGSAFLSHVRSLFVCQTFHICSQSESSAMSQSSVRMTITRRLTLVLFLCITGMGVISLTNWWTLSIAKVHGPYYQKIVMGKDVIADILPPPEYIVESYLTALQMVDAAETGDDSEVQVRVARLQSLHDEFESRHKYWTENLTDEGMRPLLLTKAYDPAKNFYEVIDRQLIPACRNKDVAEAKRIMREVARSRYEEHRAAIDELVTMATEYATSTENEVQAEIASRNLSTMIISGLLMGGAAVVGLVVAKRTSSHLGRAAFAVQTVARDELSVVGEQMRQNAQETTHQATLASGAAEQVSTNAQALATAVEEFNASIKEISGNTSHAATVASAAVEAANRTNSTVMKLGESSAEIGNVIKVINSIAEQTNLLALNATIEAARAGEAGKGFAVVANEVKELAKQTSQATEDIIRKIAMIQDDTQQAVDAIGQVSGIIRQISESQNAIASAVEEQSAMTGEISRNISEVAAGSSEIARNITRVAEAAKNTSEGTHSTMRAAGDIEAMADDLLSLVGEVRRAIPRPVVVDPSETDMRHSRSSAADSQHSRSSVAESRHSRSSAADSRSSRFTKA